MQEPVGDELPDGEPDLAAAHPGRVERPERKGRLQAGHCGLQQEDRYIGNDQGGGDGRHGCWMVDEKDRAEPGLCLFGEPAAGLTVS